MADAPPDRRQIALLAGALAAGAALRLAFLHDLRDAILFQQPVLDALEYLLMARRILEGHLLWDQVTIHSPLYAYLLAGLLALFRDDLGVLRAAQAIGAGAGTTLLVWAIARRCAGGVAAGVSAWLAATLWPLVYQDSEILVESVVVLLNAGALYALLRAGGRPAWLALGGLLLGLSTITRPNAAAFVPVAALWAARQEVRSRVEESNRPLRRRGREKKPGSRRLRTGAAAGAIAAVLLGAAIPVVPVLLRNRAVSGAWILQTNGGLNFYIGNRPGADGTPNVRAGRPWAQLVAMASSRGISEPAAQDAFYRGMTLRWWREEPGRALALFGKKVFLFWNAYETRSSLDVYYFRRLSPALSLPWPGFGAAAPLALLGAGIALFRRRPETDLLLLYAATYTLATAIFAVSGRYRIPIVPAVVPLAGIGAADLIDRLRSGSPRRVIVPAAALLLLAAAVRWTPAGVIVRDNAEERYNEGTRLMEVGRLPEAERAFRDAWAQRKDDGRVANNLGALLLRTGRSTEGLGWLRTAVRLYPEVPEAWANLGAAATVTGRPVEAERAYRESLRVDPNRGATHLGFGLWLLSTGDRDGAAREFGEAQRLGAALPREAIGLLGERETPGGPLGIPPGAPPSGPPGSPP